MKKNRNLEKHGSGGKKTAFFFCSIIVAGTTECATDIAAIAGHNSRSSSSHIITCTQKKATLYKRFNTFRSTNIFSLNEKQSIELLFF
jgi:hypothetical protein